jgi:hypothetical protein
MVDVQADFNYVQKEFVEYIAKEHGLKDNTMAMKCYYEYVNSKFTNLAQNIFHQSLISTKNEG